MQPSFPVTDRPPASSAGSGADPLATASFHPTSPGASTTTADPSADPRVLRAVEEYVAAKEAGCAPPRDQFLGQHADIASALGDFLGTLERMQAAASPRPGERVGDYELLEQINRGGMGVVYKARHLTMGRTVALKTLRGDFHDQPDLVERFFREVRATARLNHPNIVPIYEVGQHQGHPFYTMAFVSGGTLAKHKETFAADPKSALALVEKIARAVHHAHEQGILHRDLKPGNILLDEHGEPLVTDFGLAKFRDEAEVELTQTGAVLGTPAYMAPEQAAGRTKDIGPAADVWALGVLLFELLAGRRPFVGESTEEIRSRILTQEVASLRSRRRTVSRDMETIVIKCLEKEPARRYIFAGSLADDLGCCRRGEPIHSRPASAIRRMARAVRRHPIRAALAVVLPLALIALAVAEYLSDPERPLRDYEKRFQRGQSVTLIGENGLPRWHRWHGREGTIKKAPDGEGILVECPADTLLELWPNPPSPPYRFRAQVRIDLAGQRGRSGIFFGLGTRSDNGSEQLQFASYDFGERVVKANESASAEHVKDKVMMVLNRWWGINRSSSTGRIRTEEPDAFSGPWRDLTVDITPESFLFWSMNHPIGSVTREELARQFEELKWSDAVGEWLRNNPGTGIPAKLPRPAAEASSPIDPRDPIGIYLNKGSTFFRNVIIEPISAY